MNKSKYYVKYMVSMRCKNIVHKEVEALGITYKISEQGAIEIYNDELKEGYKLLKDRLKESGLVLLGESESKLIDKIINDIIDAIHFSDSIPRIDYYDIVNKSLISGDDSLIKIFSDVKGMSVLQYIVIQKIERAKEFLLYGDMSFFEISEALNYKNEYLFIAQFRKVTGLKPSYYKDLKKEKEKLKMLIKET